MSRIEFSTTLPAELVTRVNTLCRSLHVRRSAFVETAIREKLDDLLDAAETDDTRTPSRRPLGENEKQARRTAKLQRTTEAE